MKMPFGKWKGIEINELPVHYLKWAAGEIKEPFLLEEIDKEIQRRDNPTKGTQVRLPKQVFMEKLGALLMECPDEFLSNDWFLTIPRGKFKFRIRKEE